MTSASSGPRLQSSADTGEMGAAVGGEGAGVLVGAASVGSEVGPSAGGVLVLVGSRGEEVEVDPVQADRIMQDREKILRMGSLRIWVKSLHLLDFVFSFASLPVKRSLILPSSCYRTILLE